jgi:hypothetical protein
MQAGGSALASEEGGEINGWLNEMSKGKFCCEAGFSRLVVFVMIEWQRGVRDVLWNFTLLTLLLAYDLHCSSFVAFPAAASHGFLSTPLPPRTYLCLDPSQSAFGMPRSFFCLVRSSLLVLVTFNSSSVTKEGRKECGRTLCCASFLPREAV